MSNPPGLPGVERRYAQVNGLKYHYLFSQKSDSYKDTIVLVHGFPDLSYGWRKVIPYLSEKGYRVIAVDTIGYGGTDAPLDEDISKEVEFYTAKQNATCIKELVEQIAKDEGKQAEPVIVVGHDWGSYIAQRFALWYPDMTKALSIVCVPWTPVTHERLDIKEIVKILPNFAYQIQFAGGDVDKRVAELGDQGLRNFTLFGAGGKTEDGKSVFDPKKGLDLEALGGTVVPTLYTDKDELDYVFEEYKRHGAHPPLNAYRVMPLNARDEKALPKSSETQVQTKTLFIRALRDKALPPFMSQGMDKFFAEGVLTVKDIDADHFVQLEKPDEFNKALGEWLDTVVSGQKSSL
ncbi:hypothetical protein FFLO_04644 [Filobasidium floriforme]|uniref:AB hydrolase-1 domain-containing protein n=1 Tax=Filobasidium floriforme TaxID=5210 RepID=A0A8K0NPN9_9TREE|nr:hypothetical protein FFLO_04644 [Filobasidium floriforme]